MNKLVFLDFDGVLHPSLCSPSPHFCEAERFLASIDDFKTDLRLAISSSWRLQFSSDELQRIIPSEISQFVVGATPQVSPGKHQRIRKIAAYLKGARQEPRLASAG